MISFATNGAIALLKLFRMNKVALSNTSSSLLSVYSIISLIFSAVLQGNNPEVNTLFSLSKPSDQAASKLADRHVYASMFKTFKVKQRIDMNTRNQLLPRISHIL